MSDSDKRIGEAIRFMRRVSEGDSVNRVNAQFWRKFRNGDQWPADVMASRMLESRPCITVNKTDTFCRQVENQQRQQRPRIKVEATDGTATRRNADVLKGMIRHIESNRGGADMAYDRGFSCAVTEGVGYWRIMSDYTRDDAFEQELFLQQIDDPGSVYYDDHSSMPDGSDAEQVLIVTDMAKAAFRAAYPGVDDGASFVPADMGGFSNSEWVTQDTIRVAEFFTIKRDTQQLCQLSDGTTEWADRLPPAEVLQQAGIQIVRKRKSARRSVQWCKMTAMEVVEERALPGRWIPIIPCYGEIVIIDGKRRRSGLVKNSVGPAQMANFWKTAMTETVALAPKAKWLMAEGQDEGHENEWATANLSSRPALRYKPTDVSGQPAPPPQRLQPEPPPAGSMAMAQAVDADLTAVLGIVDPAMRIGGNVSGKALQSERLQSDTSTFHFYDNMTRSIAFTGRQLVDLLPSYYNEPGRVVRIVGDDGKSTTKQINAPSQDDPTQIIHDVTVGQYDVVMDCGPGFNTKRQEAVDSMMPLFQHDPELMKVAGDVMFRNMDFPGSDTIADRLAAANPMSQVDDESDIPPAAQMQLKQQQQQIQHLMQQLQAARLEIKQKQGIEQMRQDGETKRELMRSHTQIHIEDAENNAWMQDVHTKAQAQLSVAEINAVRDILLQGKQHKHEANQLAQTAAHEDSQIDQDSAQ